MGLKNRRNLIFAMVVVNLLFIFGLIMYALNAPAFYVVGGDSMEHKKSPQFGFIDNKDGVIVKPFEDEVNVITYYEGKRQGYMTFGDYGDVISFDMKDIPYPISHRAICFVKYNLTGPNITVDIPELGLYGVINVTFEGVGFRNVSFHIDFSGLYMGLLRNDNVEMEGFLTKGDNRDYVDQGGRELVANHSILGRVEVVDNELAVKSPYEYIFIIFVIVILVSSYFSDLMFKGKSINRKHLMIYQKTSVLVLFIFIFYKDVFIILSTEKFGISDEVNYLLYAAFVASVPIILGYVTSKVLKGEKRNIQRLIPIIIIGAFFLYFFIMTFITRIFFYSLVAYSFAVSLIYLSPLRYFHDTNNINEKEMSGWIFIFSFVIFVLILMINMSLPFYSILLIGTIFTNYFCVSLLKSY